jgi:hypothetical protein
MSALLPLLADSGRTGTLLRRGLSVSGNVRLRQNRSLNPHFTTEPVVSRGHPQIRGAVCFFLRDISIPRFTGKPTILKRLLIIENPDLDVFFQLLTQRACRRVTFFLSQYTCIYTDTNCYQRTPLEMAGGPDYKRITGLPGVLSVRAHRTRSWYRP